MIIDVENETQKILCHMYTHVRGVADFFCFVECTLRVQARDAAYTYAVSGYGDYMTYPLSGGDGKYAFAVYESVPAQDNLYAMILSKNVQRRFGMVRPAVCDSQIGCR